MVCVAVTMEIPQLSQSPVEYSVELIGYKCVFPEVPTTLTESVGSVGIPSKQVTPISRPA
ncbi:MAG: hypothetical protein ACXAC2_05615 [Candidatus Kariarchaeaceae archaeon]